MSLPSESAPLIQECISDLVNGRFDDLESSSRGGRLTAKELRFAVSKYGRKLVEVPEASLLQSHVYPVENEDKPTWIVEVDLWTEEEGPSDLTLSLLLTQAKPGVFWLEITDLHVL